MYEWAQLTVIHTTQGYEKENFLTINHNTLSFAGMLQNEDKNNAAAFAVRRILPQN